VFFKFKPEIAPEERALAIAALRGLPEKIKFIRQFEVGEDLLRQPRSWDAVLVSTFDDLTSLQAYAKHDDHQPVIDLMKKVCESVGSVDFEVE
jgi:hypothetical protein